jgi:hypothetical protein
MAKQAAAVQFVESLVLTATADQETKIDGLWSTWCGTVSRLRRAPRELRQLGTRIAMPPGGTLMGTESPFNEATAVVVWLRFGSVL